MNNKIIEALKKPAVYTPSGTAFWDDDYISGQMLKAHLAPDFEGASRKLSFIEKSAVWLSGLVPPSDYPQLLDIGCGPGIYAERFARAGYQVTGVDFSRRSIDYARQSARSQGLDISYLYQNYLEMELQQSFDFAVMIYCDYGALSADGRKNIMDRVYRQLKPGGCFVLDVFSMAAYRHFRERQTWELCQSGGFWRPGEYAAFQGYYKYPENVTLDLTVVVSGKERTPYYLWNTYFTVESLAGEAENAGFKVHGVFGDIAGAPFCRENDTLSIFLKK